MSWRGHLKGDSIAWLVDHENPGVRYLALRDLAEPSDSTGLQDALRAAQEKGPIAAILNEMEPAGYLVKPGSGYAPKYRGTVWSIIALAQLGARADHDPRIRRACAYLLDHALTDQGMFTVSGTPSGTIDCLQGNLCAAFADLGYEDSRLDAAVEWMARSVTGEGVAPQGAREAPLRYYAGKCGPDFCCGANNTLACAWGAVKVVLALGRIPAKDRTPLIARAIDRGTAFLLSVDPATAKYPTGYADKPSRNWWKFGFPVFYVTDLLQNVEALVRVGYAGDKRLDASLEVIRNKQDESGRWSLEYHYTGKTWVDWGPRREPSPWVTLRALRVLKRAHAGS